MLVFSLPHDSEFSMPLRSGGLDGAGTQDSPPAPASNSLPPAGSSGSIREQEQAATAPSVVITPGQQLGYPLDEPVSISTDKLSPGWIHLGASVKGFNKSELQDASAVITHGESIALVVCDGAGSKKHSKAGADCVVSHLQSGLSRWFHTGASLDESLWRRLSEDLFLSATKALDELAAANGASLSDYGCTAIVIVATPDHVACAHVGDGRAGYLDSNNVFRSILKPYKGAEANSTIFVTMLTPENIGERLRSRVVRLRTRAVMALSDGPENVCWHTSTMDKQGQRLTDPNMPSAQFFGKIANQLVAATVAKVPPAELNAKWAEFLTSGIPELATEIDDKSLLFALRK